MNSNNKNQTIKTTQLDSYTFQSFLAIKSQSTLVFNSTNDNIFTSKKTLKNNSFFNILVGEAIFLHSLSYPGIC